MSISTKTIRLNSKDSWKLSHIGELATYWNGRAFKPEEWQEKGRPIIRIENLNSPDASYNYFEGNVRKENEVNDGDLLVSWSASLDVYWWDRGRAVLNQHIFKVEENKDIVQKRFLFYLLHHAMSKIRARVHGATMQHITKPEFERIQVQVPSFSDQDRITAILNKQMAAVERARKAAQERLKAATLLPFSFIRKSISDNNSQRMALDECLVEVKNGVGAEWQKYRLVGATRGGIAPAKEGVGKSPERYKLVDPVTVFYNPMRILLGSIAMVDEGDEPGITSPDYVVLKGKEGILDTRWFYYWFRSAYGGYLIDWVRLHWITHKSHKYRQFR